MLLPMVATDTRRRDLFRAAAREMAARDGLTIRELHFTEPEIVQVFSPPLDVLP
jgi:hypothetical protein